MKSFVLVMGIYNLNNFIGPLRRHCLLKVGLPTVVNIQLVYSDYKMDTQMTVQDYLLKFRKISSLESLKNFLITLTIP
jgi:hypothetical protein